MEKLIDLSETGNEVAVYLCKKAKDLMAKNEGLWEINKMARGDGISDPSLIGIYYFAPCTSVEVERFFSILHSFVNDRPHIGNETVFRLMFVKYNCKLLWELSFA